MTKPTTPVASLGALLAAVTEAVNGTEQRLMARLDDVENRIVGLEDTITELGKQADEIKDRIYDKLEEIKHAVDEIDVGPIGEVAATLDELADAERRRERANWLTDIRRAG